MKQRPTALTARLSSPREAGALSAQGGPGWPASSRRVHLRWPAQKTLAGLLACLTILAAAPGAMLIGAVAVSVTAVPKWAQASSGQGSQEYWQTRYRELKSRVASLKSELEQKRAEYSRKRHSQRLRGEQRSKLLEEIADLEKQLAAAERELAEFPEAARKAGALPGWFRDL